MLNAGPASEQLPHHLLVYSSQRTVRSAATAWTGVPSAAATQAVDTIANETASLARYESLCIRFPQLWLERENPTRNQLYCTP